MATITAEMVRELREKTGAGMMDCKKALTDADGNLEQAFDELRKRGQAIADKKAARGTKEGLIFSKVDGKLGVLIEIGCETDFVARNAEFLAFGQEIADLIHAQAALAAGDVAALAAVTLPSAGKPIGEALREKIAKIGENMSIARYVRLEAAGDGYLAGYIHPPGKLGVLIELKLGKAESASNAAVQQLARDLAMQIAAACPTAVDRDGIPASVIERERAIFAEAEDVLKKPEAIRPKIIEGKLGKFYKDACLLEQQFVKDGDLSIQQLLEKIGKEVGDTLTIARFERFIVGGGNTPEAKA